MQNSTQHSLMPQCAVVLHHPTFGQPPVPKLSRRLTRRQMERHGLIDLGEERYQRYLVLSNAREQAWHKERGTTPGIAAAGGPQVPAGGNLEGLVGAMQGLLLLAERELTKVLREGGAR